MGFRSSTQVFRDDFSVKQQPHLGKGETREKGVNGVAYHESGLDKLSQTSSRTTLDCDCWMLKTASALLSRHPLRQSLNMDSRFTSSYFRWSDASADEVLEGKGSSGMPPIPPLEHVHLLLQTRNRRERSVVKYERPPNSRNGS